MIRLLLKQNELDSVYILGSAMYNLECSVDHITTNILNGKTTLKQNINILNQTFSHLGYADLKLGIFNGEVVLTNFDYKFHDNLLLKVCEYFLLDSPVYKALHVLLYEKKAYKESLLSQVHISESYLSKIMKEINEYIQPANVAIISRKKEYIFDGPITNWLYMDFFTRLFFSILESPFEIEPSVSISHSLKLASDISSDTNKHEFLLESLSSFPEPETGYITDTDTLELIELIINQNNYITHFDDNHSLNNQQLAMYNIYMRLASSSVDTPEQRKEISRSLIKLMENGTNNRLIHDTITLVNRFFSYTYKEERLFSDEYYESIYLILIKQIKYRLLGTNIEILFDVTPDFLPDYISNDDRIGQQLLDFSKNELNSIPLSNPTFKMIDCYKKSLFDELYTIVSSGSGTPVYVYVKMNYKLAQAYYVKKIMTETFSSDSLLFTKDINQADLVISDHHLNNSKNAPLFYLLDSNSSESLDLLFTFILKLIMTKKKENISKSLKEQCSQSLFFFILNIYY